MAWFTSAELKNEFAHYAKVVASSDDHNDSFIIPSTQNYLNRYLAENFTDANVPDWLRLIAKNYAINKILADDENVRIAQSRGQPSFQVAGNTLNLDLRLGRNPLLSPEDQQMLDEYVEGKEQKLHVDRVVTRNQGRKYQNAPGRDDGTEDDYIRPDGIPNYFTGQ